MGRSAANALSGIDPWAFYYAPLTRVGYFCGFNSSPTVIGKEVILQHTLPSNA